MKILKGIAVITAFVLAVSNSYAQTADEVVDKYFDAIGGKEKLATLKTLYSEGEMTIMNNPAPFATTISDGKGYKNEITLNGQQIITCYTVGSGWTLNPLAGVNKPAPLPADQVSIGQATFDLQGPLFDYKAKGSTLELSGREKLNGTDVFKLNLTTKDGTKMYFWVDATKWWLLKMSATFAMGGNAFEIVTISSNYQKTNAGVFMPYTVETTYPGLTVTAIAKIIDINKTIDLSVFKMPQ